jgi:hypothetical protein
MPDAQARFGRRLWLNKAAAYSTEDDIAEGQLPFPPDGLQNRRCSRIITGLLGVDSGHSNEAGVGHRCD